MMTNNRGVVSRVVDNTVAVRASARLRAINERKEALTRLCPNAMELEKQINGIAVDFADKIMRSAGDAAALGSLANDIIASKRQEQKRLLAECGLPGDYLEVPYFCKVCRDTGYVGGELCGCMRQAVINECFSGSGINPQENFESARFDLLKDAKQNKAIKNICEYCKNYADSFPDNEQPDIFMYGPPGVGKTFLLNCIAGRVLGNGHSVLKITAYRLIQCVLDTLRESPEERPDFILPDLLIIDDLGTEPIINNVTLETILSIICERQDAGKPIIVATNHNTEQLAEFYGGRIASRLLSPRSSKVIPILTDSVRLIKQ